MPAFTFEKIAPPTRGPVAPTKTSPTKTSPTEQKRRGVIVQVLGRFVEARVQRADSGTLARRDEPSGK